MQTRAPLALLFVLACGGTDPKHERSPYLDADHDGFPEKDDCNDEDPAVHPDSTELCDGIDNDCSGEADDGEPLDAATWYRDADGDEYGDPADSVRACLHPDGYAVNRLDCDDTNADSYPGATENCDDTDNDCDGTADEGTAEDAATWYLDSDGDGWGTPYSTQAACTQPSGFVAPSAEGDDCNDADEDIHPGAPELCAGYVDEDCDGLYDDDDDDVTDPVAWYGDADADLWGNPDDEALACDAPDSYVAPRDDGDDCDDTSASVNPSNVEVCGNGDDDDCDGSIDEEDAPYPVTWYTDSDGDGYGDPSKPTDISCGGATGEAPNGLDCNDARASVNPEAEEVWYDGVDEDCAGDDDYDADADGYRSSAYSGTDCVDSTVYAHPGRVEICGDGLDNDCDGEADPCDSNAILLGDTAGDGLGSVVAGVGDWNGDGKDDVLVAADRYDGSTGQGIGAAWLVIGPVTGSHSITLKAKASWTGEADRDRAGSAATGGDLDGDGYDDAILGALGEDSGGTSAGAAYLVTGPGLSHKTLSSATARLVGEAPGDAAGTAVANAGDVDGDGNLDLLVAAPGSNVGGAASGAVYLLHGPLSADLDLSYADARLAGEQAGDAAGTALAGSWSPGEATSREVDGDGYADFLVGAPTAHPAGLYVGAAYLLTGPVTANTLDLSDANAILTGADAGDLAGTALALAGDLDGDGFGDVVVGAPGTTVDGVATGAVRVMSGDGLHTTSVDQAVATILGQTDGEYFGASVAGPGDLDGDGNADLVVGARYADDGEISDAGAVWVFMGPLDGTMGLSDASAEVIGASTREWLGYAVGAAGDVNADGDPDLLVGSPWSDDIDTDSGRALLILGGW